MRQLGHVPARRDQAAPTGCPDHRVAFYDDDGALTRLVVELLEPAARGGRAVIVAEAAHRAAFVDALADAGVDVAAATADGRLVVLDAAVTLGRFMIDGMPDAGAFAAAIRPVLGPPGGAGPVRVYGEMVTLLWEQGQIPAAMALEGLWNSAPLDRPFTLLCGYPSALFTHVGAQADLEALCGQHTDVATASHPGTAAPAPPETVRWHFPAELTSGARARALLRDVLDAWHLDDLRDEAELLVSELVNNAVVHACSEASVDVSRRADGLRIAVTDSGAGALERGDGDLDDTCGRGLLLVEAISSAWGTQSDTTGKTVWFELRVSA